MPRKKKSGATRSGPNDVPPLTDAFFDRAEIRHGEKLLRRGRPPLPNPKQAVKLRLDADVLAAYRATGDGWQTRINTDLRKTSMTKVVAKFSPPSSNPKPPHWGNDELSKFIEAAHQNQYATFFTKREAVAKLVAIDAQFSKVTKGWLNPPSEIIAMLFIRCHGAYRTACSLAMSGQAAEAYVQCRSVLEYAAYAVHINRNPALGETWLNRHVDDAGMKASKRAFQHVTVLESVTMANRHAAQRFETIYQRTIDFGGHPNERAVTANMKMTEQPDRREMLAILQHGDGKQLNMALKTTAQCGMIALELLETIYGAKFELLGIKAAMLELRRTNL